MEGGRYLLVPYLRIPALAVLFQSIAFVKALCSEGQDVVDIFGDEKALPTERASEAAGFYFVVV